MKKSIAEISENDKRINIPPASPPGATANAFFRTFNYDKCGAGL
jgi:hypothetical protein